jgi:hypothetical protein
VRCVLCTNYRPPNGVATADDLCPTHTQMLDDVAAHERRVHPDGHCTETCGCMTLEELDRRLAEREGTNA